MKVGIMIYLEPQLLTEIESKFKGNSRSEKMCKCLEKGIKVGSRGRE
jgi:hypothetical protein